MFEIVIICTGNRNRSPIVEASLKRALSGLPVKISSAGLLDLGQAPALPETLEVARRVGLDISEHRARCLANVDVRGVDLVVGLEWEHVAAAVVDHGAPTDRSFTLIELTELLEGVPEPLEPSSPQERARALVAAAGERKRAQRGFRPGTSVTDPFGGRKQDYLEMATTVTAAADRVATRLFGISERP